MPTTTKAIIWDMDGVLIDSGEYHFRAWRETLKKLMNTDISQAEFQRTFGQRNVEMLRSHFGHDLPEEIVNNLSETKEARYRDLIKQNGIALMAGVRDWLDQASAAGWRQAVASSAPRANIDAVIETVNIGAYFDAVISAEDVIKGKPDPEVYLAAAAKLNVIPVRCIVVEDAPVGISGAKYAGMKCIGVLTTHESLDADVVTDRLSAIQFITATRLLG